MKHILIGCAGLLLLTDVGGQAQGLDFQVSPLFGYRFGGSLESSAGEDLDLDAGPAYGLALEAGPRDTDYRFGLLWSRQESEVDFEGLDGLDELDVTVDEFMFTATRVVYEAPGRRLRADVTGLVGATVFDAENSDTEVRFSVGLGAGAQYFLLENLSVRADLRGYCTFVEAEGAFISSGGNTVAYFSGSAIWQGEVSVAITLAF